MMNFIKTIGAFSLTFFLSVALVGVPKSISDFLAQDVSNGYERDANMSILFSADFTPKEIHTTSVYKQIINDYAEKSKDLDDSDLPSDFQAAWRDHMAAWSDHANLLNQRGKHCKMSKYYINDEEFARTFEEQDAEITRTWFKVLSVARQHGVVIPRNYY